MAAPELAVRARRAYETGRVRWALTRALAATAVSCIALAACPERGGPGLCAALLGAILAAALWRGGAWARGARLGFLAGLAPCLLPAAVRTAHLCSGRACPLPVLSAVCLPAGLAAGLVLGWWGAQSPGGAVGRRFWLAAVGVTLLAGAVGCLAAGLGGLAGMALGVLAGAAGPVLARRAA
jgi:hypothetical protein